MRHILRKSQRSTKNTPVQPVNLQPVVEAATDPTTIFHKIREQAIGHANERLQALAANLRKGEFAALAGVWNVLDELPYHVGVVATAEFALQHATRPPSRSSEGLEPAIPEYIISSRFLTQCHTYLTGDTQGFERMHLVTGIELSGNRYTLDHMDKVALSQQSATGAKADQQSLRRVLTDLDSFGSYLHALFHSHPGSSPGATRPSDIDFATHQRFENGGYPLIGAIFVPGFVRFFSANRPFTVTVKGKGIEQVPGEKNVFKTQNPEVPGVVSYETSEAQDKGRGDR